jgi:hypothetical protein
MTKTKREASRDWPAWITQAAFLILLALVAARCTILESLREPFSVSPGSTPFPRGPGAATSMGLDLLCGLPALLILFRRAVDRTYSIRFSLVHGWMLALTGWMVLSVGWADDKFATVVSSANFAAAMILLWSASQLVRSWTRLRIVAAFAFGLLLILLIQGFYYKFVEMPATIRTFEENRTQWLQDRRIEAGSFADIQFERKAHELLGFSTSSNSFAGIIVLLMVIGAGILIQQIKDHDPAGLIGAIAASFPLAIWLLVYTQCKAAMVTPILALVLLGIIWKWGAKFAAHAVRFFWVGTAAVLLGIFAVVGHGLFHHSLPTASLNFRWRYWTASWKMFWRHPIRGIGWDNFAVHYLRDRLPAASEEIRDPHNFLVRFFVELGVVGGVLAIAWLGRLWWELTRPVIPPFVPVTDPKNSGNAQSGYLIAIALAAVGINLAVSLDFPVKWDVDLLLELMRRSLFFCALAGGMMLVSMRWLAQPRLDDRPSPWILYALLVSVGVFLIHNLIEFSLFEVGATCLFGLLIGSGLGVRHRSGKPMMHPMTGIALLAVVLIGWISVGALLWAPIAMAESAAALGDNAFREANFEKALAEYQIAMDFVPYNADYAFHAGSALHYEVAGLLASHRVSVIPQQMRLEILAYYGLAIDRDPSDITAYIARGEFSVLIGDPQQMMADFDKALELNPNEVSIHREYAVALKQLGLPQKAVEQLQLALAMNDQLDKDEPKRLSAEQLEIIHKQIAALQGGAGE